MATENPEITEKMPACLVRGRSELRVSVASVFSVFSVLSVADVSTFFAGKTKRAWR
jgi:hypothetical protein